MKKYKFWLFGLFADCVLRGWVANSYEEAEEKVKEYLTTTNRFWDYKFETVVDC